jgi:3-hydroxybutyryl-CoA dehydrogenase
MSERHVQEQGMTDQIRTIAVIGAGIMGHGIALEFANAGYRVRLTDASDSALTAARTAIEQNLLDHPDAAAILERIVFETSLTDAVHDAEYVIEAVTENLPLKQHLFEEIDRFAPPHAILSSNSSSFMPSQLAPFTSRPDKVLVTHYFNPPHVVPLVEVVRGPETSSETVETVRSLYEAIGKIPVVVEKERLGFIGNRLQLALFREALALLEDGVASVEDIDTVIHTSIGRRWSVAGVFEVFDLAGLDTVHAVATALFPDLSNATGPSPALSDLIARGDLGIKSGKGFYDWPVDHADEAKSRIRRGLMASGKSSPAV